MLADTSGYKLCYTTLLVITCSKPNKHCCLDSSTMPKAKPIEIDVLYVVRPQVEKWSEELLRMYCDILKSAKKELERRGLSSNTNKNHTL